MALPGPDGRRARAPLRFSRGQCLGAESVLHRQISLLPKCFPSFFFGKFRRVPIHNSDRWINIDELRHSLWLWRGVEEKLMTEQEVLAMPLCLHFDPQNFPLFVLLLQRLPAASEFYHHGMHKLHLSLKHVLFLSCYLFKPRGCGRERMGRKRKSDRSSSRDF